MCSDAPSPCVAFFFSCHLSTFLVSEAQLCFQKSQSPPKSQSCSFSQLGARHACSKRQNNSPFFPGTAVSEGACPVQQELGAGAPHYPLLSKTRSAGRGLKGGSSGGEELLSMFGMPRYFDPFSGQAAAHRPWCTRGPLNSTKALCFQRK